jgi:hypothetical protein
MRKFFSFGVAALVAVGLGALTVKAAPPAAPQGQLTAKVFLNIPGGTGAVDIASLTNYANFPNHPDLIYHPPYFESFPTGDITVQSIQGDWGDGYGDQILGYFYPPTNGNYTFWIASDDYSDLYLSTDSTPQNKVLIAQDTAWSNRREYGTEQGNTTVTTENDSSTFTSTQWATKDTNLGGALITLTAGQAYYIEALHHEGGGGDDLSVSIDGISPIPSSMVSSYDIPGNALTATATGSAFFNSVTVTFSEPVDPATATTLANYSLSGGLTISSASLNALSGTGNSNTVVLATSLQPTNTSLTLTINNVKDWTGSNTIAASSKVTFPTYVWLPGWMTYEQWTADGLAQDLPTFEADLSNGVASADNLATSTSAEPQFDGPWYGVAWNNFNSVSYAWFSPPTTGDYVFFVDADAAGDLFLSTDGNPANKHLIAEEAGGSSEYQWETGGTAPSGGLVSVASDKRSDTFGLSAWPTPNVITLTNGQMYYMEVDHHQGTTATASGAGVAYMLATDPNIATGPAQNATSENMTGSVIGTYLNTNGASVSFTAAPASTSVVEGFGTILTVGATGTSAYSSTVLYQWQEAAPGSSTFTDILGATSSAYNTGLLGLADSGMQYRVVISVPGASTTSSAATVTVTADITPPTLVSAGSISNQLAGTEIGVIFSKALGAGAATLANYSLDNGATISAASYVAKSSGVVTAQPLTPTGTRVLDRESGVILSVSPLDPTKSYHLTVTGVQDEFGNKLAAGSVIPVSVSPFTWVSMGETVTNSANPDGATNETFAVGTNSFNLVNGGNAFWGTEDDITMVYETVKGDFDRTVQVEWNEPASHWARAGISARASVALADDFGTTVPQYQMVISDPETNVIYGGVEDSPGNDQYETNRRLGTGDATDGNNGEGNPHYPNSYVRLKRVGQFISMYYSSTTNDDKWWYPIGTTDFNGATDVNTAAADPLPDTLFVGPTYGCENGNISGQYSGYSGPDLTGEFVARFRNYAAFPQKPRGTATSVIGLNFGNSYATVEPGTITVTGNFPVGTLLGSNDIAGVDQVAQGNWNNVFGYLTNFDGVVEENEKTGATTSLTNVMVGIASPNLWSTQGPGSDNTTAGNGQMMTGEDAVLMTGYLDSPGPGTTDVGVTNIPADMTSQGYDVIVYAMGGVSGRGGGYAILDTNGVALEGYYTIQAPATPTGLIQAMADPPSDTPTNWAVGNFVVFTNLKASAIIVEASTVAPYGFGGTMRAPINGIQLISPPGLLSGGVVVGPHPSISVASVGSSGILTYTGVLRSSPTVGGPYTPVIGAVSPYTIPVAGGTRFFVVTSN